MPHERLFLDGSAAVVEEMKKFEVFAQKYKINFIDSYTNFITFIFNNNKNSQEIGQILLKKGIIIRNLTSYGINGIRVTIGTPEQNSRFLNIFEKVYNN